MRIFHDFKQNLYKYPIKRKIILNVVDFIKITAGLYNKSWFTEVAVYGPDISHLNYEETGFLTFI